VTFGSSSALAAAYGLAVSGVMVITSIAMFRIARIYWKWGPVLTGLVWSALLAVNAAFLVACSLKFLEGGWVPLSVGAVLFVVMVTWRWGSKATFAAYSAKSTMTMSELVTLHRACGAFMERNAVVMAATPVHHSSKMHVFDKRFPAVVIDADQTAKLIWLGFLWPCRMAVGLGGKAARITRRPAALSRP
jgi:KUP system potassium uptake protein